MNAGLTRTLKAMKALLGVSAFVALSLPLAAHAASSKQNYTLPAVMATAKPPIDGNAERPEWRNGAHVTLDGELTYRKGIDGDRTDVYMLVDKRYLYIAWICAQHEPVVAQQRTNDAGTANDDFVSVILWPDGRNGTAYSFTSTPAGAHTESSMENTAFAPHWDSAGRRTRGGYEVTMRIPRDVLRDDGHADWSIQFARYVSSTQAQLLWSYDPSMSGVADPLYIGTLVGINAVAPRVAARPKSRLQVYGVGALAARSAGGDTSRAGVDFSVPVSRTASVFGTVHPDYSEVEYDQQSISPVEFERYYREVRPFFTQGANFYNATGVTDLYTPSIPTPRYGYAVEGANNGLHYAAFDAVGEARDDDAQSVNYVSPSQRFAAAYQRTAVTMPGFIDDTQSASVTLGDGKHFSAYTIFGEDNGTRTLDPARNRYRNVGANLYAPNESIGVNLNAIGEFYNPYDGFITNPGVNGYNAYVNKVWPFGAHSKIQSISVYGYLDRYHDAAGVLNQTDSNLSVSVSNRHNSGISVFSGSSYLLANRIGMIPYNQPSISFWDNADPRQSFYGGLQAGHFLNGFERYYYGGGQVKAGAHATFDASYSENVFTARASGLAVQTLESLSYSYQFGPNASGAVGLREIQGSPAGFAPSPFARYTNLSFAYNQRLGAMHLYAVYGDPNALTTTPAFIFKLVRFVGGDEGT